MAGGGGRVARGERGERGGFLRGKIGLEYFAEIQLGVKKDTLGNDVSEKTAGADNG